jgi:sialate O-acetylesterase
MRSYGFLQAVLLALFPLLLRADVYLPSIMSSHMVLQRDQQIHLFGWAAPGETVSVEFNGSTKSMTADTAGHWGFGLPPEKAGGPYQLKLRGASNTIVLDDVMVGDVWFASGQSNMEMPLNGFPGNAVVTNAAEEIRNANQPQIRLLLVKHKASDYPQVDYPGTSWTPCTPETAAKFSAVAYFFGRAVAQQEHVAIGLIDATWGGTPGEAWVSMDGLSADPSLMPVFAEWADFARNQADLIRLQDAEKKEDEAAEKAGRPKPQHTSWHPDPSSWAPAALYNGMVAPAVNYRIKGVIWYQGESNSGRPRATMYEKVFSTLITDWRKDWRQGDFPFLFVQISSYTSTESEIWGIVREAQRRALTLPNTAMAVTIDIGDPKNVHPADKQDVGARLALAARAVAYREQIEYSGPLYHDATVEGNAIRVQFDHAANGLKTTDAAVQGFEVAGDDHHFVPASAKIDGSAVIVSSSAIPAPRYVRYGWANVPTVNLYNRDNLPAATFTSEPEIPRP